MGGHALRGVLDFVAIAAAEGALGQALSNCSTSTRSYQMSMARIAAKRVICWR